MEQLQFSMQTLADTHIIARIKYVAPFALLLCFVFCALYCFDSDCYYTVLVQLYDENGYYFLDLKAVLLSYTFFKHFNMIGGMACYTASNL